MDADTASLVRSVEMLLAENKQLRAENARLVERCDRATGTLANEHASTPIMQLHLPARVANALILAEIHTVGELCRHAERDLVRKKGIGRRSVREIRNALDELGLTIAGG